MARYWPTPEAIKNDPIVARGMNSASKIVFSRTLNKVDWNNTRLVKNDMLSEIRKLKQESGKDLTVLGSGSIVSQLAQERLIDEYQILLNPVVIGMGKTMFEGVQDRFSLTLTKTGVFGNGNVLLSYKTAN
jgi:dihydrofolate reductase